MSALSIEARSGYRPAQAHEHRARPLRRLLLAPSGSACRPVDMHALAAAVAVSLSILLALSGAQSARDVLAANPSPAHARKPAAAPAMALGMHAAAARSSRRFRPHVPGARRTIGPASIAPRFGGIVEGNKSQLDYRLGDLVVNSTPASSDGRPIQAALALTIRNVGRNTLSVALMRNASLQLDTGVALDVQIPRASGITLCNTQAIERCLHGTGMAVLRPGKWLTANLVFTESPGLEPLGAARVAGFSGNVYVRDVEHQNAWMESATGKRITVRSGTP